MEETTALVQAPPEPAPREALTVEEIRYEPVERFDKPEKPEMVGQFGSYLMSSLVYYLSHLSLITAGMWIVGAIFLAGYWEEINLVLGLVRYTEVIQIDLLFVELSFSPVWLFPLPLLIVGMIVVLKGRITQQAGKELINNINAELRRLNISQLDNAIDVDPTLAAVEEDAKEEGAWQFPVEEAMGSFGPIVSRLAFVSFYFLLGCLWVRMFPFVSFGEVQGFEVISSVFFKLFMIVSFFVLMTADIGESQRKLRVKEAHEAVIQLFGSRWKRLGLAEGNHTVPLAWIWNVIMVHVKSMEVKTGDMAGWARGPEFSLQPTNGHHDVSMTVQVVRDDQLVVVRDVELPGGNVKMQLKATMMVRVPIPYEYTNLEIPDGNPTSMLKNNLDGMITEYLPKLYFFEIMKKPHEFARYLHLHMIRFAIRYGMYVESLRLTLFTPVDPEVIKNLAGGTVELLQRARDIEDTRTFKHQMNVLSEVENLNAIEQGNFALVLRGKQPIRTEQVVEYGLNADTLANIGPVLTTLNNVFRGGGWR